MFNTDGILIIYASVIGVPTQTLINKHNFANNFLGACKHNFTNHLFQTRRNFSSSVSPSVSIAEQSSIETPAQRDSICDWDLGNLDAGISGKDLVDFQREKSDI